MGLDMYFEKATGLAKCKTCKRPIKKGLLCIHATDGWRADGHCHVNRGACVKARVEFPLCPFEDLQEERLNG